jgi:hypothetical protein
MDDPPGQEPPQDDSSHAWDHCGEVVAARQCRDTKDDGGHGRHDTRARPEEKLRDRPGEGGAFDGFRGFAVHDLAPAAKRIEREALFIMNCTTTWGVESMSPKLQQAAAG